MACMHSTSDVFLTHPPPPPFFFSPLYHLCEDEDLWMTRGGERNGYDNGAGQRNSVKLGTRFYAIAVNFPDCMNELLSCEQSSLNLRKHLVTAALI